MKIVQRANKQLSIPDDKLEYYQKLGYQEVTAPEDKPKRKAKE